MAKKEPEFDVDAMVKQAKARGTVSPHDLAFLDDDPAESMESALPQLAAHWHSEPSNRYPALRMMVIGNIVLAVLVPMLAIGGVASAAVMESISFGVGAAIILGALGASFSFAVSAGIVSLLLDIEENTRGLRERQSDRLPSRPR
jgi:hypothetical protein